MQTSKRSAAKKAIMARTMQASRISRVGAAERQLMATKAARKAEYDCMVVGAFEALTKGHKATHESPPTRIRPRNVVGFSRNDVLKFLAQQHDRPAEDSEHAHLGLNAMKRAEAPGKIKFVSGEWPTGTFRLVPTTAENTAEDAVPAAMSGGATTEKTSKAIRLAQPKASATDPATNRKVAKLEKKLKVLRQLHSGYHKDDQARIRNLLAQVPKTKVKQVEKQFKELEQQNGDFHKAQQHKIDNLLEKIQKLSS